MAAGTEDMMAGSRSGVVTPHPTQEAESEQEVELSSGSTSRDVFPPAKCYLLKA